jgi:hypothetical protein
MIFRKQIELRERMLFNSLLYSAEISIDEEWSRHDQKKAYQIYLEEEYKRKHLPKMPKGWKVKSSPKDTIILTPIFKKPKPKHEKYFYERSYSYVVNNPPQTFTQQCTCGQIFSSTNCSEALDNWHRHLMSGVHDKQIILRTIPA